MRFVHLTDRRNLASIRRSGLRLGRDLVGRGVCCVPLMMMKVQSPRTPDSDEDEVELTSLRPQSSSRIWGGFRCGCAVVFQPRAEHWPADVYLWGPVRAVSRLRQRLRDCAAVRWIGSEEGPSECHVALQVAGPRGMGLLMRHYLELRPPLEAHGDQAIEVVFRKGIPSNCIRRVVEVRPRKRGGRGAGRRSAIGEQGE
jgi:hypothetical protein